MEAVSFFMDDYLFFWYQERKAATLRRPKDPEELFCILQAPFVVSFFSMK